jgi:uncharacterized protein YbjT (DUF2867 family)
MENMTQKRTIAVFGATGAQGGGVVAALKRRGAFTVRALTRKPASAPDGLGDEVAAADFTKPETLIPALEGAYGVFVNTNSFAGPDVDEVAQGTTAVEAAKAAGIEHYIWSTLPNVAEISAGQFKVPHFTNKATVDAAVAAAGFRFHTFVEPPFYYQNLISPMYAPQPGTDGTPTWSQPMRADARGMHMGDIEQLGSVAAGAFEKPETVGTGQHLSAGGDLLSWDGVVAILRSQGHDIGYAETQEDLYGLRDMFAYFEKYTYYGPNAPEKIAQAKSVSEEPLTDFRTWAATNMPVPSGRVA